MNSRNALIGIILNAFSATAPWLLSWLRYYGAFGVSIIEWQLFVETSGLGFFDALIMSGPSVALSFAGLAMYVRSRNDFWKANADQSARISLVILGAILMILGGWFALSFYGLSAYLSGKHGPPWDKPISDYLTNYSPYFVVSLLWFMSGIILMTDALKKPLFKIHDLK